MILEKDKDPKRLCQKTVKKAVVLCIEELPLTMRLALWLLDPVEYEIVWAKTIQEGYELAQFYTPKIMLIDSQLQGDMSLELIDQICSWSQFKRFPQHVGLVVEGQTATFRFIERLSAVNIDQICYQDLPRWLTQLSAD